VAATPAYRPACLQVTAPTGGDARYSGTVAAAVRQAGAGGVFSTRVTCPGGTNRVTILAGQRVTCEPPLPLPWRGRGGALPVLPDYDWPPAHQWPPARSTAQAAHQHLCRPHSVHQGLTAVPLLLLLPLCPGAGTYTYPTQSESSATVQGSFDTAVGRRAKSAALAAAWKLLPVALPSAWKLLSIALPAAWQGNARQAAAAQLGAPAAADQAHPPASPASTMGPSQMMTHPG